MPRVSFLQILAQIHIWTLQLVVLEQNSCRFLVQAAWDVVIYRHSASVEVFLKPCGQTIAGAAAQDVHRVEWRTVRGSSQRFELALKQIRPWKHAVHWKSTGVEDLKLQWDFKGKYLATCCLETAKNPKPYILKNTTTLKQLTSICKPHSTISPKMKR